MKKQLFFSLALAALMLGACSDDNGLNTDSVTTLLPGENGFISMSINLPTTDKGGTRAPIDGVDGFDDGEATEYQVNNAKLLLFGGADEATATCQSIYTLTNAPFQKDDTNKQITSTATIVQSITVPTGANIYALVVLNDNGLVTDEMKGQTLNDFTTTAKDLTVSGLNGNGFFMSNAPMSSSIGGNSAPGNNVTTLAVVEKAKIYPTEAEARNNPATTVYVERALSKVTVSSSAGGTTTDNNKITNYTINGWILDNTNKSTYLVRNVAPTTSWWDYQNVSWYRFVDDKAVKTGVSLYRTHFGIDPNYNVDCTDADLNQKKGTISASALKALNTDDYCLENTFDVLRMKEKNTTRVIIAAELEVTGADSDGSFYILNDDNKTIYTETTAKNAVKALWLQHFKEISSTYIKTGTFNESNVTVTLSSAAGGAQADGGYVTVTGLTISEGTGVTYQEGKSLTDIQADATAYMSEINDGLLKIAYYKGGVSYYQVLIKHFGDEETPWDGTTITGDESYPDPDKEAKWLGRYGVLRNTWYKIDVTGLRNIGSPEVPEVTEKWDDPLSRYISVEINILAWAIRSQDVIL